MPKTYLDNNETRDERYARGKALVERMGSVKGVLSPLDDIAPDLGRLSLEFSVADILERPGLDLRTRMLCTIAALTAKGTAMPELKGQIGSALRLGCTREEITEAIMQMCVWAGFPAAIEGLMAAKDVFAEEDGNA